MDHNNQEKGGFTYTYSAKEQAELKRIRDKYTAPSEEEDKMARLRRLDRGVTQKAQTVSLILGIVCALVLGLGMSLIMTDLAEILGVSGHIVMLVGVAVGVVGAILASLAYPIYHVVLKREKARIAPEILRLTDELLK